MKRYLLVFSITYGVWMQSCIIVDDKEVKRIIPSVTREFALYARVYVCSLKILEKIKMYAVPYHSIW